MHDLSVERRRLLLDESREGMAALQNARGARRERAREGDLFVLKATAGLPVEWALLERHAEDPGRFLAVPADTFPGLGPGDLAVDPEGPAGPLALRCRYSVWLDEELLEPRLHAGTIAPEARARATAAARRALSGEPPAAAAEPAGDLPYQDWVEGVLQPARSIAASLARLRRPRPRRLWHRTLAAPVAAGLLALLSAALFVRLGGQQQRIGEAQGELARERQRTATLNRETADLRGRLTAGESERQRLRQELATRPLAPSPEPLVNQPLALLSPSGSERGATPSLRLDPKAQWIGVVLSFAEDEPAAAYQVELWRGGGSAPVWSRGNLARTDDSEIRLLLPRSLLPAGAYRFRLSGTTRGARKPVAEYTLRVSEDR